ncbi:MAG: hypothetical protein MR512_00465, partial [Anaerococcus sp.]|nr:hypothetical protein [Anaerococcus sp.]
AEEGGDLYLVNGNIINIKDNTTTIINEKIKADIVFEKVDKNNIDKKLSGTLFILEKEDLNNNFHPINQHADFVEKKKKHVQ